MDNQAAKAQYQRYLTAERGYSPETSKAYLQDIAGFQDYLTASGGFTGFDQVEQLDVRVYLGALYDQALARTTIARKISALRGFYSFLQEEGQVQDNPFANVALRKHQAHLPEFFYEDELTQLFQSAYAKQDHPLWQRDAALLEFLFATGVRVSELVGLQVKDLDMAQQLVLVHGKGQKDRILPFGSYAKKALQQYLTDCRPALVAKQRPVGNDQAVFLNQRGQPLTAAGVTYILQQLMNRTSLTGQMHPHMLRHSFATALLNRGADMRTVQELLGHANLSTTQIYTHVSNATLQSSYQHFFPRAQRSQEDDV
ncbi:tyrosine recombinase XerC [Leuconostocaceae bacterium ESL0958]|nr:tyrosine recombinase XerC [Leuconostocaceae bacterium ESL0958]